MLPLQPLPLQLDQATRRPNLILFLQDDQDLTLGGWEPMKKTQKILGHRAAIASNWFAHTPVCAPSRGQMLTGHYFHNIRQTRLCMLRGWAHAACKEDGLSTMHVRTDLVNENSFGAVLGRAGYSMGWFGKHMNDAPFEPPAGWGCETCAWFANNGGPDTEPKGFFNASFSHWMGGKPVGPDEYHPKAGEYKANTNGEHAGYTTSIVANYSIDWLRTMGRGHQPWMMVVGSKAPHVAAAPAPWYERGTFVDALSAPRTPAYNASKQQLANHHWLIAQQEAITPEQGEEIDEEFRNRWRSLLSVDDAIEAVAQEVQALGASHNTYFLVTSDHGYNLGQHRLPTCKLAVYDQDVRIPMLIAGPGVRVGPFAHIGSNVDVAPTLLDLAGISVGEAGRPQMDGASLAPLLVDATDPATPGATAARLRGVAKGANVATAPRRDFQLIEYYSLGHVTRGEHLVDDPLSNTYRALRFVGSPTYGDFLYAEFTAVQDWNFENVTQHFYEAFDMSVDPGQLNNIYHTLNATTKQALAEQVHREWRCKGREGAWACA
eukprot:Transcript_11863.p1 GENE.Transcript_11863~~Transcript_11863.p1  ORF type:complete len:547 (-),score=98.35 Transcript_11863:887-2527(-)